MPALQAQPGSVRQLLPVRSAHPFADGLKPDVGFSFTFDGKRTGPTLPADWKLTEGAETTFRHTSGLTIVRTARAFPEFEAVEYTIRFKNSGSSVLPPLSAVNAMDLSFVGDFVKGASAVTSGGGANDAVYPPKDFALSRYFFGPMTPLDGQVNLITTDGFSSMTHLPFFYVENQAKAAGIFASIGWTGSWKASIQANYGSSAIRVTGGMADLDIKLEPGEEIIGPSILVGCYRGPLASGVNRLRRLIRDRYMPSLAGKKLVAPVIYTTWFDIGVELDDKLFRSLTDRAADLGIEIFLMDAGWYKGTVTADPEQQQTTWNAISNPLGNWELGEELSRFPSGLRSLADYVRSKGMQFGLWFEPERNGPESHLAKTHPDWVSYVPGRRWGMVNFGKPEVQEYFEKIISQYIKDTGVRYLRWDQNSVLNRYWQALDPPGRRGITEIRHLEGLHKVEDYIREHHPDVIFESCASGGRRIDLPTIMRRHTIWISDQTMDPHLVRFHLEGLNHFLPGNGQMVGFSPPTATYQKPGFTFPDLAYQSMFGGAFGIAGRLHEWSQAMNGQARTHIAAFKKIRDFVDDDFYMLAPQSRDLENWSGWQFHDPESGGGFVQAFRIQSTEAARRLSLKGLDAKSNYQFTDVYSGTSFEMPGAKLLSAGPEFKLPEMSSQVLTYRRTQ